MNAPSRPGPGKLNIYVCTTCRGHVVTRDRDEGVTPFMMVCLATADCRGHMKSSLYNVFDQTMREDYVWRRATDAEVARLSRASRGHHEKGGLFLARPSGELVL